MAKATASQRLLAASSSQWLGPSGCRNGWCYWPALLTEEYLRASLRALQSADTVWRFSTGEICLPILFGFFWAFGFSLDFKWFSSIYISFLAAGQRKRRQAKGRGGKRMENRGKQMYRKIKSKSKSFDSISFSWLKCYFHHLNMKNIHNFFK